MSDCPFIDAFELENGQAEVGPWTRKVQEISPPGLDGTAIKHMGLAKRKITVTGILEGEISGTYDPSKLKKLTDFEDTALHEFKLSSGGPSLKKVRVIGVKFTKFFAVKRDGDTFIDAEYEVEMEQLKKDGDF